MYNNEFEEVEYEDEDDEVYICFDLDLIFDCYFTSNFARFMQLSVRTFPKR